MKILVTGACGKVGKTVIAQLRKDASIQIIPTDIGRGIHDTEGNEIQSMSFYQQADLVDAGAVYSLIARFSPDAVIHIAAVPDPTHNAPSFVFQNNIMSTFNIIEACVRLGVKRLVNISRYA